MIHDEGYIKFDIDWENKDFVFPHKNFVEVNNYRQKLFDEKLIGAYPNGIGYGNISQRRENNEFVISGSATGSIEQLSKKDYALVKHYDILRNFVQCIGLTKASSESLSHAVLYEANQSIRAIIHIHHKAMWEKYLDIIPTTNKKAAFGTPEMAVEIRKKAGKNSNGIIVMGGHEEGVISYGRSLDNVYNVLMKYYKNL